MALTRTRTCMRFWTPNSITRCMFHNQFRKPRPKYVVSNDTVEKHRHNKLNPTAEKRSPPIMTPAPRDYKYVYPEFLPNAKIEYRDRVAELLQRRDMIRRRSVIDIPEFYVGTIMAVTVSDPYAPAKKNRFVGLCIARGGHMLESFFVLRNIVDGEGVEIMYKMYNPTIRRVEVLKLEKRLDEELYYLRDAPSEHSTIPFDLELTPHPPGAPVPVNSIQILLNPIPWHDRWERMELKGAILPPITEKRRIRALKHKTPWEKHDLMKQYRNAVDELEVEEVMAEIHSKMVPIAEQHNRKRTIITKV